MLTHKELFSAFRCLASFFPNRSTKVLGLLCSKEHFHQACPLLARLFIWKEQKSSKWQCQFMGDYFNEKHSYREAGRPRSITVYASSWWVLQDRAVLSHLIATSAARVFMNLFSGALLLAISTSSWRELGNTFLLFSHYQLAVYFKFFFSKSQEKERVCPNT